MDTIFCRNVGGGGKHTCCVKKFQWKRFFRKNHRQLENGDIRRETERTNAVHKNSQNTMKASRDHRGLEFVWQRGTRCLSAPRCHTNSSTLWSLRKNIFSTISSQEHVCSMTAECTTKQMRHVKWWWLPHRLYLTNKSMHQKNEKTKRMSIIMK